MSNGKSVFISGGATGIGAATAAKFLSAGWRVAIGYHNQKPEARSGALAVPLDLRDDESIRQAAAEVLKEFGSIDVLINNAGILRSGFLHERSFTDIHEEIAVNLEGMIKLTKELLPKVNEVIINIGSGLGFVGKKRLTVYAATKWAVRGFTKSLAKETPGLRAYAVHPALTATAMGSPKGMAPSWVAGVIFDLATGRLRRDSGAEISMRDYRFGRLLAPAMRAYHALKKLVRLAE